MIPSEAKMSRLFGDAVIVILTALSPFAVDAKFLLGRLHPADYDLSELNGLYRPTDAALMCDDHPTCAGFTYRGLLNTTNFPDKK